MIISVYEGTARSPVLTGVDIPDLDAAVVEPGGQQQLVLSKPEVVPLDVDAAALFFGHRGAEGHAPDDVSAVDGVLRGLAANRDHRAPFDALPGKTPGAGGVGDLAPVAHRTRRDQVEKNSQKCDKRAESKSKNSK